MYIWLTQATAIRKGQSHLMSLFANHIARSRHIRASPAWGARRAAGTPFLGMDGGARIVDRDTCLLYGNRKDWYVRGERKVKYERLAAQGAECRVQRLWW